tara:strand:+ start:654 stop:1574 length:921 start_codon:yes stop_codon:yes gene_type:complete
MQNFARNSLKKKKFIIFGGGFSGQFIADEIRKLGCEALTSSRQRQNDETSFVFDSLSKDLPPEHIFESTTHVISCIPPDEKGKDPVLSRLNEKLKSLNLEWVGYLSTTGVYGNTFGEWVTEKDPVNPLQDRSKRRLQCERSWLNSNLPIQIFRLPGIYGPGRSTFDSILKKNIKVIHKPNQVFSRIHVADIANAIIYLLLKVNGENFKQIINIADNYPSSQIEVIEHSYKLLGLKMPEPMNFDNAKKLLSPMALSFWKENRRVSNTLLCKDLGYKLIHENYESGLRNCLEIIKQQTLYGDKSQNLN